MNSSSLSGLSSLRLKYFCQPRWPHNCAPAKSLDSHGIWEIYANKKRIFASVRGSGNYTHLLCVSPVCPICEVAHSNQRGNPSVVETESPRRWGQREGRESASVFSGLCVTCSACRGRPRARGVLSVPTRLSLRSRCTSTVRSLKRPGR